MSGASITRRHLLAASARGAAAAAGATALAVIPAGAAGEADETPIQRMFHACQEIRRQAGGYIVPPGHDEDAELERLFYRRKDELEDAIMAAECRTPADFAIKVLIGTCWGDFNCSAELWSEVQSLTGFEGPWA